MREDQRGFLYIMVLFAIVVISIMMLKTFESWEYIISRDKEEELIFRGEQIVNAITLYNKKKGAFPDSLKKLYEEKYLRRLYKDPISEDGEWNIVSIPKKAGKEKYVVIPHTLWKSLKGSYKIVGVVSPVHKKGFRVYKEKEYYDEWLFAYGIKDKIPPFKVLGEENGK